MIQVTYTEAIRNMAQLLVLAAGALRSAVYGTVNRIYPYRRYVQFFAGAVCAELLVEEYLFSINDSEGSSMFPTIPDARNTLFVNKTYRNGRGIQVGDCVQIRSPIHRTQYSGKRVIGLPGDYVLRSKYASPTPGGIPLCGVTDWKKRLDVQRAITDHKLNQDQIMRIMAESEQEQFDAWEEPEMIQVPEGHIWVEGDNLAWSRDSRFYGAVPMALVKGRSWGYIDGFFSGFTSLKPGRGLRRVEDDEITAVLGD